MSHRTKLQSFDLSEDIFLVSYPRSGNTWLRLLIGNYLTHNQCDFTNLNRICPDYQFCIDFNILHELDNAITPRIFKSHSTYKPEFKRVAYIVRDGRDVVVSYYFYSILIYDESEGRGIPPTMSFEEFAREIFRGNEYLPSWKEHISSWLDNPVDELLLIRYEDLHANTSQELARFLDFFGIPINQSLIDEVVEKCKFENLKKLEVEQRDQRNLLLQAGEISRETIFAESDIIRTGVNRDEISKLQFMRKGKIGDWRYTFTPSVLSEFLNSQGDMLAKLQYIDLELIQVFQAKEKEIKIIHLELAQLKSELEAARAYAQNMTHELEQCKVRFQEIIANKEKMITWLSSSIQGIEIVVQRKNEKIGRLKKRLEILRSTLKAKKAKLEDNQKQLISLWESVEYLSDNRGALKTLARNIKSQACQLFKKNI